MNESSHFLIIGLGLLGGSYASGLSQAGYKVSAIDPDQGNLNVGLERGWIIEGSTEVDPALIQKADVLIFGVYPRLILTWIEKYQHFLKPKTLLTDMSGVKAAIVDQVQQLLRKDCEFVAAHPMAGKEVSGAYFSDPCIFEGANFIITPTAFNTVEGIATIRTIATILNFASISEISVQEHDRMIAFVSQLTHVIAVTLMNTHENAHLVKYTGDSFRDLTRIAKINENLWSELFLLNKEVLLEEIDHFQESLTHFKHVLEQEDLSEMKRLFVQSTQRRKLFDK